MAVAVGMLWSSRKRILSGRTCWQRNGRVNSQSKRGIDHIGSSCNDIDMEETLVKENVCWIVAVVTLVSHSKTGTTKISRVSTGNLKRLQICSIFGNFPITKYGIIPLCHACGGAVLKCWPHCWPQWTWILSAFFDISWYKYLCLVTHIINNIWDPTNGWGGLLAFNIKVSPWHIHDGEIGFWQGPGGLPSHLWDFKYY